MGNLRQKYTDEEWDELVNSTKPGFVEKRIKLSIHQTACDYAADKYGYPSYEANVAERGFIEGANWILETIKNRKP